MNEERLAKWAVGANPGELLELVMPGQTQRQIAEQLGVAQPVVSGWKTGKHGMARSIRYHLLRIMGVALVDGEWVDSGTWNTTGGCVGFVPPEPEPEPEPEFDHNAW